MNKPMKKLLIIPVLLMSILNPGHAVNLSGTVFEKVGIEKDIDPHLLYAVALAESAYSPNKKARGAAPYPWTLRLPERPIYATSKNDAEQQLSKVLTYTSAVDVGLMQVNVRWHKHRVKHARDLLDPETNVRVGADILLENLKRYPNDLIAALGRYHSSRVDRRNQYGLTVYYIYQNLKLP